jgi:hypothetical protein
VRVSRCRLVPRIVVVVVYAVDGQGARKRIRGCGATVWAGNGSVTAASNG